MFYSGVEHLQQTLNIALPEAYQRAQGDMSPVAYSSTDDPRAILINLQRRYGKRMPAEKEEATIQWS